MRVGCGGCGGDASTLDGMTAAEIIAAASGGGGGGDTIVEYELTSTEFIDVDQWAPSGGDGSVTLLVAQDATGYHEFGLTGTGLTQPWGAPFARLAPGTITPVRLLYVGGAAIVLPLGPRDISGIDTPAAYGFGDNWTFRREFDDSAETDASAAYDVGSAAFLSWIVNDGALIASVSSPGPNENSYLTFPYEFSDVTVIETAVSLVGRRNAYGSIGLIVGEDVAADNDKFATLYLGMQQDSGMEWGRYQAECDLGWFADQSSQSDTRHVGEPVRLRISQDGSDLTFSYAVGSADFWISLGTLTAGFTPNRIGFYINGQTPLVAKFHYLRAWAGASP